MGTTPSGGVADRLPERTHRLDTLDPAAPLDDLEPLREIVGSARVVAVGEGAHFVEEFSATRGRLARFLAERCGFTVFAFEVDFASAPSVDRWLGDRGSSVSLHDVSPAAADWGADGLLHWMRGHNAGDHPLRFVGIDVPEAGGALRPVLEPLAGFLAEADPDALPWAEEALRISDSFLRGARSVAVAIPRWAALDPAEQDRLTMLLARLRLRLRASAPELVARTGRDRADTAERWAAAACVVDDSFRAMHGLFSGTAPTEAASARDLFMAETVRWHLEHGPPDTRIVLAVHNNHIQKTRVAFGDTVLTVPMGRYLAGALGDDYVSVALTHTDGHVPDMRMDDSSAIGFTVVDVDLPDPEPGSIEAGLVTAGMASAVTLTDVRGDPRWTSLRSQSGFVHTQVSDAFDAVLTVPSVTRDRTVRF